MRIVRVDIAASILLALVSDAGSAIHGWLILPNSWLSGYDVLDCEKSFGGFVAAMSRSAGVCLIVSVIAILLRDGGI